MTIDFEEVLRPAHRFGLAFTIGLHGMGLVAVCGIAAAIVAPGVAGRALVGIAGYPPDGVSPVQGLTLVVLILVQAGLWAGVFAAGRALCRHLEDGNVDTAARAARHLSLWLWALLTWSILGQAVGSVAVSWHMPEGERTLAIGLGAAQVSMALAALMAVFLARAFTVGAALWQDHKEIV